MGGVEAKVAGGGRGPEAGLEGERAVRGQWGSGGLGPEEGHGPRAENDGCTVRSTDSSLGVTVLTGVSGPPPWRDLAVTTSDDV